MLKMYVPGNTVEESYWNRPTGKNTKKDMNERVYRRLPRYMR